MTMANQAGTKRISDVHPLTTGSGKGGHVMIKTNKHTTKPSKKLTNPNNGLFKMKELDV
jgi:hypothetical protein